MDGEAVIDELIMSNLFQICAVLLAVMIAVMCIIDMVVKVSVRIADMFEKEDEVHEDDKAGE